jgi:transcription elongation GreA/GreB family factor
MTLKQTIHNHCLQMISDKIKLLQAKLADLRQSADNETKSSAGDKYETARAMLHIEQENTNRQLAEVLAQQTTLLSIDITAQTNRISMGSLVITNQGLLFVSVPLGKITIENNTVIVLSPQSPLGAKLLGLVPGQSVSMNNSVYQIEQVS